jgi:hypothetical protein
MMGVNRQYIQDAETIKREAPELIEEVQRGTLTIPQATKLAVLAAPAR